jgi:hypothetical protein
MISTWERRGNMVTPACPPTTGTLTSLGLTPSTSAYNNDQESSTPMVLEYVNMPRLFKR